MEEQQRSQTSHLRRYLWHFNRTPGAHILKTCVRLLHYPEIYARKKLAKSLPRDEKLSALAASLNEDGFVRLDEVIDPACLSALSQAGDAKLKRADEGPIAQHSIHKHFWTRLLDEDMVDGRLPTDNPFVRFALQPSVIGVLARALGEVPKLDYVLLTLSRASNKPLAYSQLWHRDYDDTRTIKLFVYLTEVAEPGDGPFTFIPGKISDRFGFSLRSHRPDDAILKHVPPESVQAVVAPRLSAFLVETSRCLHMGSRLGPGHSRLLYTATFLRAPRIYPEPPSPFLVSGKPDPVTQLVLGQKVA
jgi:hypothetical protein